MNHPIKTPYGETVFCGSKKAAENTEKIMNARAEFIERYIKKKGWNISNVTDLSIDQILEINDQEEWKKPL